MHTQNATTAVRVVKPKVRYFQLLLLCKVGNGRNTTSPVPSSTTHPTRAVGFRIVAVAVYGMILVHAADTVCFLCTRVLIPVNKSIRHTGYGTNSAIGTVGNRSTYTYGTCTGTVAQAY